MARRIYNKAMFDNQGDMLGIDWGNVIGQVGGQAASTAIAVSLQNTGNQNGQGICGQTQLRDDGQIALCLDRMMNEVAATTANMSDVQKLAVYESFYAFITNPQYFLQTASPHYLGNQIRLWPTYIAELRQRIAASGGSTTPTTTVVTDPATGQLVTVNAPSDNTTLYLIGGGVLLLLLLKKR